MTPLTLAELEAARDRFDDAAARTHGIDAFCSSTDWGLPAHEAFMPQRTPRLYEGAHGFAAFMEQVTEDGGRVWLPLEVVWGLGCPLLGAEAHRVAADAINLFVRDHSWDALLLTGLAPDAQLLPALAAGARRRLRLGTSGPPLRRCMIDLEGGVDAYLGRRSRNLRRALLRARARAAADGLTFESIIGPPPSADPAALYERLLAVERRSWKGAEGGGLATPEMQAFYRAMVPRLASRGRLVLTFARHEEQDVGFILGGVFANAYRGLQFSYDEAHAARALGNVMQLHTLEWAAERGLPQYDLGAEVEYKLRWADRVIESLPIVVRR